MIHPLKFRPILKERLWGGTKLKEVFGKPIESDITGESWELSTVKGDISVVANGSLEGKSLQDLIDSNAEELLGKSVVERFGKEFPILIKFIDAKQDLSIQLHPNDALAKERHDSFGKTEMWYIMDADPKAELIVVKEGDTFFINTGKIHAIGAGVMLAEIQQTSDVTYRVFDFNRKDKEGNLRELHTDLALDAVDYEKKDDFIVSYDKAKNEVNTMVDCPYFKTNFIELTENLDLDTTQRDSFTIFMCVGGEAKISTAEGEVSIKSGETALLPASTQKISLHSTGAKLLEVTI